MSAKTNRLKNRLRITRDLWHRENERARILWRGFKEMETDRNQQRARKEELQAQLARIFDIRPSTERDNRGPTYELVFHICKLALDNAKSAQIKQNLIEHCIYRAVEKLMPTRDR